MNRTTRATPPVSRGVHARRFSARVYSVVTPSGVYRTSREPPRVAPIRDTDSFVFATLDAPRDVFRGDEHVTCWRTRPSSRRETRLLTPSIPRYTPSYRGCIDRFRFRVRGGIWRRTPTSVGTFRPVFHPLRRRPSPLWTLASTLLSRVARPERLVSMAAVGWPARWLGLFGRRDGCLGGCCCGHIQGCTPVETEVAVRPN